MLLNNWNPATGLVRRQSQRRSGELTQSRPTGSLARQPQSLEQIGVVSRSEPIEI